MEKARIMVVLNGVNDARQWDHMWGRPACCSNKSPEVGHAVSKWETIVPDAWAFQMSGL